MALISIFLITIMDIICLIDEQTVPMSGQLSWRKDPVIMSKPDPVAEALIGLLADTYALYMKTHGYHWNVTGPQFHSLHTMFQTQYTEMWTALDVIAERVRALGAWAPGSGKALSALSAIGEQPDGKVPDAAAMLRQLVADHETLISRARDWLATAQDAHDDPSADLITQRLQLHQKTLWMLNSSLG